LRQIAARLAATVPQVAEGRLAAEGSLKRPTWVAGAPSELAQGEAEVRQAVEAALTAA
jgi:hypothetical protein